jgi:Fic-DOC domain mobile mystery protein B
MPDEPPVAEPTPRRSDFLPEEDGTTPLDPDEADGLIPDLLTRGELNAWEQANILKAEAWVFRRRRNVLTVQFAMELHQRMFDETWTWAGKFRRSDKNIGVPWPTIPAALRDLLDDTQYWIDNITYALDESAARFHHRLVSIHPFPNGNGRHGRLMTDVLARSHGAQLFTWGRGHLAVGQARIAYLAALRQADKGSLDPLVEFMRS